MFTILQNIILLDYTQSSEKYTSVTFAVFWCYKMFLSFTHEDDKIYYYNIKYHMELKCKWQIFMLFYGKSIGWKDPGDFLTKHKIISTSNFHPPIISVNMFDWF